MTDKICGTIERILCYPKKGAEAIKLDNVQLISNRGMEGDFHADGGERQLSLLSVEARKWMEEQSEKGLCFPKFRENFSLSGITIECIDVGTKLEVGNGIIEISAQSKHCYEDCRLFYKGQICHLSGQSLFAKVTKSGQVHLGDKIILV